MFQNIDSIEITRLQPVKIGVQSFSFALHTCKTEVLLQRSHFVALRREKAPQITLNEYKCRYQSKRIPNLICRPWANWRGSINRTIRL